MERTFEFHYSPRLKWLFLIMGMGPKHSSVALSDDRLRVHMGPWFRLELPRSSLVGARRHGNVWWAIGVHTDFHRSWLVNGASTGIVVIDVVPDGAGRSFVFPANVRTLGLGLEDPEGFLAALGLPEHAPAPRDAPPASPP